MEANLGNEQFGVSELAREMGMNRTVLYRKVKLYTNKTISKFISEIRLKRALELLRNDSGNVSEVAYEVGFGSPTYFIKCFNKQYGFPPGEVLKGMHPVTVNKEEKEINKHNLTLFKKYIFIIALIIVVGVILSYIRFFRPEENKITIVIPVFNDENPVVTDNSLKIFREEFHSKLQNIEALNVISSSVTEMPQYMNMSNLELAKSFNADYILNAKRISVNNIGKIYLHLSDSKGIEIWNDAYPDKSEDGNIFDFCAEIALDVTSKLQVSLKTEERNKLLETPSENLIALNYYNAGINELENVHKGIGSVLRAKRFFENALKNDSNMAEAYVQMSHIYIEHLKDMYGWAGKLELPDAENLNMARCYLDSGRMMADKAIQFDDRNSRGYRLLADYFRETGDPELAKKYMALADRYAVHDIDFFLSNASRYSDSGHHYEAIECGIKYLQQIPMNLSPDPNTLNILWLNLGLMGFDETSLKYEKMYCEQRPDSFPHFARMAFLEMWNGNFEIADDYLQKNLEINPTSLFCFEQLMFTSNCMGIYEQEFEYMLRAKELMINRDDSITPNLYFGSAYINAGLFDEALFHLNPFIEKFEYEIEHNRPVLSWDYLSNTLLSYIYAGLGEKEKTFYYLNALKTAESNYGWLKFCLTYYPEYDKYRNTSEFQNIYQYIEKQYSKEYKKIEKLLIREGIIQ
ncbi:helix-turn-helix domain-containing protein [Maribellus sediminis]|uniref:helix-turn-helix domain-containing protein n=1 Tax=Maribellus sediminis TaxID=2696285 RepID=UPI00142FF8AF|nr:AraC family transcriptional regulator [Maribellus sediminis]